MRGWLRRQRNQACMPCCPRRRCGTWTSSMAVSALRFAISSCERLAPRYKRDIGAAQDKCDARVKGWADSQPPTSMYLNRVTIAEIRYGIERLPAGDRSRRRLEGVAGQRIAALVFRSAARCRRGCFLSSGVASWKKGKAMRHTFPQPDLFIAATAVLHDLCIVTRNVGDFLRTEVPVLNPWMDTEPRPTE